MKGRMRPIRRVRHETVLDRVEMDVIDVPLEVAIVPNGMLPITTLPNPAFAPGYLAR